MSVIPASPAISVDNLAVSYRGCDALRGISLSVPKGTVFALLGENGAGKTTLIRCLTGFLHPGQGSCHVLGLDPFRQALEIRRRIGYVSDAPALYEWMRVGEIGWFTSSFYGEGFLDGYRNFVSMFQVPEDRKIKHLSKGQRAKVALSLALAHDQAVGVAEALAQIESAVGVEVALFKRVNAAEFSAEPTAGSSFIPDVKERAARRNQRG